MLFNSVDFLIFFPIVVLVYYIIPNKAKTFWLFITSYYFYMCWNAKYALLILISTIITYLSGLLIEHIKNRAYGIKKKECLKKLIVAASFVANLGILFYFKYINFMVDILAKILTKVNVDVNIPIIDVVLPVGISFYTFQALSYTMDVYRNEIYAEKNFLRYAVFVSFFPQLVAGPIERSKNLLKQLADYKQFSYEDAREGFLLILWGLFLKIVMSERISIFVDAVYGDYANYGGYYLIVASILFAFQIYCDFSGYSTIAVGAAKILGIQLTENFNAPYLSKSVAEFWRRWHISLTSWFKDYLYIPLGGNRKGKIRKYCNILVVFAVSGLWHGAQFSFVLWGIINGVYQIVGDALKPLRASVARILRLNRESLAHKLISLIVTFIMVDFSWIYFRANSLSDANAIIKSIFLDNNRWILFDGSLYLCGLDEKEFRFMIISIIILLIVDFCKLRGIVLRKLVLNQDYWFRILFVAFSILFIMIFGKYGPAYDASSFIYFQF